MTASAFTEDGTPLCPHGHGPMVLRDMSKATYEQKFCGIWHDCPPGPPGQTCMSSHLTPSAELIAQLSEQSAAAEQLTLFGKVPRKTR